jgi:hypothetical protein
MGLKVGEEIVWETTHLAFRKIPWQQECIGEMPIQITVNLGDGNNKYTFVVEGEEEEEKEV